MRLIEMQVDRSVPFDETTFTLRMTEAEYGKVERAAEAAGEDPDELLRRMIHEGSISGNIRRR